MKKNKRNSIVGPSAKSRVGVGACMQDSLSRPGRGKVSLPGGPMQRVASQRESHEPVAAQPQSAKARRSSKGAQIAASAAP